MAGKVEKCCFRQPLFGMRCHLRENKNFIDQHEEQISRDGGKSAKRLLAWSMEGKIKRVHEQKAGSR